MMFPFRRVLAVVLSGATLFSNVVLAHASEASFWEQRRAARPPDREGLWSTPLAASSPSFDSLFHDGVTGSPLSSKTDQTPLGPGLEAAVRPFGAVGEVRAGTPGAPFVVVIEDVHTEDAAQANIGRLLGALADKGVATAGLEGAWVPLELERYRRYPRPRHLARAADFFRAEGYISGPEWAGLALGKVPRLVGVESFEQYYDNVRAARLCVAEGSKARAAVAEWGRRLGPLKKALYSPELAALDARRSAFHAGRGGVGDYARFLAPYGTGPALRGFVAALEMEARLDFARAERERRGVLEHLTARLAADQTGALLSEAERYRSGGMTAGEFHAHLKTACDLAGVDLRTTPAFSAYLDYVAAVESISRPRLLDELNAAEAAAGRRWAVTSRQKDLLALSNDVDLTARLVANEMTPAAWEEFRQRRGDIARLPARFTALAGDSAPALPDLAPFEQFCEKAVARNESLVANTLRWARGQKTVALVVGGFHTAGVLNGLALEGAGAVVVTPRFEKANTRPLDAFARDPLPLERIFAGDRVQLPLARVLVPLDKLDPMDRPRARATQSMLIPTADAFARQDGLETPLSSKTPVSVEMGPNGPVFRLRTSALLAGIFRRLNNFPSAASRELGKKTDVFFSRFRAKPPFVFDSLFSYLKEKTKKGYAAYALLAVLVAPVVVDYVFRQLVFGGTFETWGLAMVGTVSLFNARGSKRPEHLTDPRLVDAGLLAPAMVEYRLAMRRQINPTHRPLRVLVGGAGADVAGALLDTDGSLFYFLDTYGPMTEEDLQPLQKSAAEVPYTPGFKKKYLAEKRKKGYAPVWTMGAFSQRLEALRLELTAMGVDPAKVRIEMFEGRLSILFPWAYAGQPLRWRRVVFVSANVLYPETYEDVLERGVDVYLQRAGMGISKEFARHPSTFLKDIAEAMPPDGVLATDDVWVGHYSDNGDNSARFPLALPVSRFPGEQELFEKVKTVLRASHQGVPEAELKGYGNRLNVRFVPAGGFVAASTPAPRPFDESTANHPVSVNKLLSAPFVHHDLAVRSIVNPRGEGKTVLYGGAGADVSNVLMTWSPERVYMLAPYPGLTADLLRAAFSQGVPPTETIYSKEKFRGGYSRGTFLSASPNLPLAIAIEVTALGVPPSAVEVLEIDGRPALRFPWEGRPRTVVFHDGRLENVAAYRDILSRGLDGFYFRAGMGLASVYDRSDSFLFDIAAAFRPGAFFVTDDFVWKDALVAKDYGRHFPFPAEEIPVPNEAVWGPMFDGRLTEASRGALTHWQQNPYGWGVRVRRLLAPVQVPVSRTKPPSLVEDQELAGLSFRDALGNDPRLKEIVLQGETIGHFRLLPQDGDVLAVEEPQVELRYRVLLGFPSAFFRMLANAAPGRDLQFSAALWVMAVHRAPDLFEGSRLRVMFKKDLAVGLPWSHAPLWNGVGFLERLRSEGISFVSNEMLTGLVLCGRLSASQGLPAVRPAEKTEATAAARLKPSDVPLRLEPRLTRLGAHGPTHVVMGLNGRTVASMRLGKNRQRAVLQSLKMDEGWESPSDVVRVFDLILAWARAGGAAELEYRGCDCLWVYTLLEGQFGPGLLRVWSHKEKKWKIALEPDMATEVRSLPPTASPTRSVSGLTLLAPTAGVLYRGTTVSDLRKNRIEESGGAVRWVGGRAGFPDAPLFAFNWREAQEYAETRQTAQDPAVVIEVAHDALAAAGTSLPSLSEDPLPPVPLAGGVPLATVRAISVLDPVTHRWTRRVGFENIRSFVFAKATTLREVVPAARYVSDPLEVNPPHESDGSIDRLGLRLAWDELKTAPSETQASRYFNALLESLQTKLADPSPFIRRHARTVLAALPTAGLGPRRAQPREERRLWERVMKDPLSADGQGALEVLRVWGGAATVERVSILRLPDLAVLESALWRAAERTSDLGRLGMPVRADIVGGSRYRFAEDRGDVDVFLSYRPDDPVVGQWLQPQTVVNVFVGELLEALPPGSRVDPDPQGARVTLPSVKGATVRFLLNIHPTSEDPVDVVAKNLKALTRSTERSGEAVALERDYFLGAGWLNQSGILGPPSVQSTTESKRLLQVAAEIPDHPSDLPFSVREQIEKRLHRPASVLLLTDTEANPKAMMILEPFLAPLKKLGRAGTWGYGAAVLALSAAEEWFFRQFLLAGGVAVAAPTWLGFMGEGYVYAGAVLLLFTFLHPVFRGLAGGLYNRPGRTVVPPERWIDSAWRLYFGAVFTVMYFADPDGWSNILAHVLVNLWVMFQHREVREGRTASRPWPFMSLFAGAAPDENSAPIANMKKSRFDMGRFLDAARRAVPQIPDEEGGSVPAKLIVMGGDWDASKGPPPDVKLVLDFGKKSAGTDLDSLLMGFIADWLDELKKTDVVKSANALVGPRTKFSLLFPSQTGKRVWSIFVQVRAVYGDPVSAVVSELEYQPRDLWERVRRVLRAEWLFGDPAFHARWLAVFHEQKRVKRAGEVFETDPSFRSALDRWRNPRAVVDALGPAAALAVERTTHRAMPGSEPSITTAPVGPVLREQADAVRGFLDLLMEGSRLDKNLETADLPALFLESIKWFNDEGYLANPSPSGRWDLFYRGIRRYFRFVKLTGAGYWKAALEWRPGWGLVLTMSAGSASRVFLINNYAEALATRPTAVLSPQPVDDLAVVSSGQRLQNARIEALALLERAVRAVRDGRELEVREEIEKDMAAFEAAAPPFPVSSRRKGVRASDRLLTLIRGDNRRLNFHNDFLKDDSVSMKLFWPHGHYPVVLLTRTDGRTLAFAVERYFDSNEGNREIGAPPLWEFPSLTEALARLPRYFDLAKTLDGALAVVSPADLRARLADAQSTTLLCETLSFPLFRSDGTRVTTLVFRAPGEYALRFFRQTSTLELLATGGGQKIVFALGRFAHAGQFDEVVGTPMGHSSLAQKGLLSSALEPLLLSVSQEYFLNYWEEPPKAAARREEFNRAAWTVRSDKKGQVPLTFSGRLGRMRQLTLPMVLSPNSVYLLQVEWFRAGGNVLTLEGKDGVHVFPLGRWLRAFRGEGDRRSVTPLRLGLFPNRTEARLAVERHPALLLRRAELAGRQRNPDPKLTGLLGELDWVFTTTVSGGYLWEDPFEGHRLFFHGLGEKGRAYRVRLNRVDGVGAVPVFNYEGSADVKSRFKIYAHLTAAVRRVLGGRDVHLFPLKGTFFQPEEVVRAIGDLRPNETDVAFGGGVPDSAEKMHQTLERLIAAYAPPPEARGASAAVYPIEGPRASRSRERSSARFLLLVNRRVVSGLSRYLQQALGEFAEVRTSNGGRDLYVVYQVRQDRPSFVAHVRLSPERLFDALAEWCDEFLRTNASERLSLRSRFALDEDANGDSKVRIFRMMERAWLVHQYFNRLGSLAVHLEHPDLGELNYRYQAWSYVNSGPFLYAEKEMRAIVAQLRNGVTDREKDEHEIMLKAKIRAEKSGPSLGGKILAAGTFIVMGGNAFGAATTVGAAIDPWVMLMTLGAAAVFWAGRHAWGLVARALQGSTVPPPAFRERTGPPAAGAALERLRLLSPGPLDMDRLEFEIDWRRVPDLPRTGGGGKIHHEWENALQAMGGGDAVGGRILAADGAPGNLSALALALRDQPIATEPAARGAGAALGARDGLNHANAADRVRWAVKAWAAAVKDLPAETRARVLGGFEDSYNALRRETLRLSLIGNALLGREAVLDITPLLENPTDEIGRGVATILAAFEIQARRNQDARLTVVVRSSIDRRSVLKALAQLSPGGALSPRARLLLASETEGAAVMPSGRFSVAAYTERRGRPGDLALVGFTPDAVVESVEVIEALGARLVPLVKPLGDELENALRTLRFLSINA